MGGYVTWQTQDDRDRYKKRLSEDKLDPVVDAQLSVNRFEVLFYRSVSYAEARRYRVVVRTDANHIHDLLFSGRKRG